MTDINVEPRPQVGKGAARKLRASGQIPGILYGQKEPPRPFATDPILLERSLKGSGYGRNTVITVKGLDRDIKAMIKDAQLEPVKKRLLHIDLIEIRDSDKLTLEVPILTEGRAKGVTAGGLLQQTRRTLKLECKPAAIPDKIVLDVTNLEVGQSIRVGDVKLPEGAAAMVPDSVSLVAVHESRVAKSETATAEAETAEAAAAPAEGEKKEE